MANIIDSVDYRSWGVRLLLDATTRTKPNGVKVIQMPSAPNGGWSFYLINRAWRASLLGGDARPISINRERQALVGNLEIDAELPPYDECIVVEMMNISVQIHVRQLDTDMLDVAVDAMLESGDKSSGYKSALDSFGTAAGIADAIVRSRVKSRRLRQTAATQGRTKASRRAMRDRH